MKKTENPFNVTFGVEPQSIIPRRASDETIIDEFERERPSVYAYAIAGVRGCGKTVLLTGMQKYFAEKKNWIVLRINTDLNIFDSAISQLGEYISIRDEFDADISVKFAGLGLDVSKRNLSDSETMLRKMLTKAQKNKKRILMVMDEVTSLDNFKIFAHSYQAFIGEGIPLFLLVTLLPENLQSLGNASNATFLRRMPRIELSELNDSLISREYGEIFDISLDEACELAKLVKGYPYAYQLLGYLLWKNNTAKPNGRILGEYDSMLDECVYSPIWSKLPEKEKSILKAMAQAEDNRIKSVRDMLDMQPNEFSPYRERLAIRGLVDIRTYGKITFRLPRFKEFVLNKMRFEI